VSRFPCKHVQSLLSLTQQSRWSQLGSKSPPRLSAPSPVQLFPVAIDSHQSTKTTQLPKENMFNKTGQWILLETFEDFDNGLSDLIDLWSSTATQTVKDSALAHFKENLEGAMLNWADNRAKMKKYTAVGVELAEFEEALK
jgi:hypothetical protein